MTRAEQIAAVLAEHAECVVNEDPLNLGSGTTGQDVWSCGITLPFADDLEEAERNHVAAALDAALAQEGEPELLRAKLARVEAERDTQYRCAQDLAARLTATQEGEPDYPYPIDALARLHDEDRWPEVVPQRVRASDLTPTQPAVTFDRLRHLLNGGEPETGDPHAHVVSHDGALYVHDGHHRYAVALARGGVLSARVVDAKGQRVGLDAQEGEQAGAEVAAADHPFVTTVRDYLDNAGITPETLRYAATHEALCRSWIFDLLTGLADTLADPAGALAKHDAEVLRAAAVRLLNTVDPLMTGPDVRMACVGGLRAEADRIAGDQ